MTLFFFFNDSYSNYMIGYAHTACFCLFVCFKTSNGENKKNE